MQARKVEMEGRLGKLRSGDVKPVSREERERVEREGRALERALGVRRGIVGEMWGAIAENSAREEWKELKEAFGLEVL